MKMTQTLKHDMHNLTEPVGLSLVIKSTQVSGETACFAFAGTSLQSDKNAYTGRAHAVLKKAIQI